MKNIIKSLFFFCFVPFTLHGQSYFVDNNGILRGKDNNQEVSFFGVNYTVPFAHAYRALNYLGENHKQAIDKDVYHFSRLGFNAYRIHIWDVEISDKDGNLVSNDHLDLLDYLIAKLKERKIKIVITTMTNFGNGYPERDIPTGGFSYNYSKCDVHNNPNAIEAQKRYIAQLVKHVNPYTNESYLTDPDVVGFEINNEPCHAGTEEQTKNYIDIMVKTLKEAGNRKPVFYNVSHNQQQANAYYAADIQGTTFQWYPTGLVTGSTRKGNFLPNVDNYNIPFSDVKGFSKKAKLIYEFDPADITYSYMYPAITRTFRSAGFQWITQFAYDPIDMAQYNTEYQTHYLNLAYTPQKAISMKIASEVAYQTPLLKKFNRYPNDTIFGNFRVSYKQDLSEMNTPEKFYYSNNTSSVPVNSNLLKSVAGCGSSPVVKYNGTGAYFLDQLEDGLWRLEVMPDAMQLSDPFKKPSLKKEVVTIVWNEHTMEIKLPGLGEDFSITAINYGNVGKCLSEGVSFSIKPGVYLLQSKNKNISKDWTADTRWNNIKLGEFVAPKTQQNKYRISHQPAKTFVEDTPLLVKAKIVGPSIPDSVLIYTDKISFWSNQNRSYKMEKTNSYTYQTTIPALEIHERVFRYNILIYKAGKSYTFPEGIETNPLDWDYTSSIFWESNVVKTDSSILLFSPKDDVNNTKVYTIPESKRVAQKVVRNDPSENYTFKAVYGPDKTDAQLYFHKYIVDDIKNRKDKLNRVENICLHIKQQTTPLYIGFVTSDGFTYTALLPNTRTDIVKIPIASLKQTHTALLPHPYPSFLEKYFEPDVQIPFNINNIERLEISTVPDTDEVMEMEIGNIWLE
ncbi:MAG: hypothetical protein LBT43_07100 [Prevotella sp.]|jgi:hypothetical protein|nr:hypothetical protein [Prevotella sp.]